jgi:hypothetical protein
MTDAPHEVSLLGDWLSWDPASLPPSRRNMLAPFLTWIFSYLEPSLSVELGSRDGETFRALCQISDRFSPRGRLVAIDPWSGDHLSAHLAQSAYEGLREFCRARHAARASVLRAEIQAAASEFEDGSIDLLHVARVEEISGGSPVDLDVWGPKLSDRSIVVITGAADGREMDDVTLKMWHHLSDTYPSALIRLPGPVGLAEHPRDGRAPLVEFLQSAPDQLSSLFRLLGERTDFRHIVGSDAQSGAGLQTYISGLTREHAEDLRRIRDQHQVRVEELERRLASEMDRCIEKADQLRQIQFEADFLLAQLARRAAGFEDQQHTVEPLAAILADRNAYIEALTNTVSWRVTRPLRAIQTRLIRAKIVRRSP